MWASSWESLHWQGGVPQGREDVPTCRCPSATVPLKHKWTEESENLQKEASGRIRSAWIHRLWVGVLVSTNIGRFKWRHVYVMSWLEVAQTWLRGYGTAALRLSVISWSEDNIAA